MSLIFSSKQKYFVLSLVVVILLILVGCSTEDDGVEKYNVSGTIVDVAGEPVAAMKMKARGKTTITNKNGEWNFVSLEKGTEIVPVYDSDAELDNDFAPQSITVKDETNSVQFKYKKSLSENKTDTNNVKPVADIDSGEYYSISARHSGKVLDVYGRSQENKGNIV